MKNLALIISIPLLFSWLMSCAGVNYPIETSAESPIVIDEPFNVVWNRSIDYLKSDEIRMTIRNTDRGYIDTEFLKLSAKQTSHYLAVSSQRSGIEDKNARIKSTIYLWKLSDARTLVRIVTYSEVYEIPLRYSNGAWCHIASTGKLEQELRDGIQKHLQFAEN